MDEIERMTINIGKSIGYCILGILWVLFFIINAHTIYIIINQDIPGDVLLTLAFFYELLLLFLLTITYVMVCEIK